MLRGILAIAAVLLFLVFACASSGAAGDAPDFEKQVAVVLIKHCLSCHNPGELKGGLDLTRLQGLQAGGETGPIIVPGKPEESPLIKRVASGTMPPKKMGKPLDPAEVATLRSWVQAGAPWPQHRVLSPFELTTEHRAGLDWWSLQPVPPAPLKPALLEATSAPEADRRSLLRRAKFDLLGLPPTPEETAAFIGDPSPDAYERLIDRLLASPHYGERWGRHWLDVVRFGESDGFENDKLRDHAWHYRDYVIRSFNADKPYAQFIKEQLAGDALEPVTRDGLLATGFLVAGPWDEIQNVAASKIEKARALEEQLEELIGAVSQSFLGMTVNCARCHDHKFDPITQADYYRLKAVFDGVDHGNRSLLLPDEERERQARVAPLQTRLQQLRAELASLGTELPADALTEGRFGKALDARRSHVALPSRTEWQTPPFTVECWTRLFGKAGFNILVANNLKDSSNHWEIYTYAGTGEFSAFLPGCTPAEIKSGVNITDGQWHHVAMTFDGERIKLSVDATLVKEQAVTRQVRDDKLGQLWIGAYPPQRLGCDGIIDEVRISIGLRAIRQLPRAPFMVDEQTLGLWRLDEQRVETISPLSKQQVRERNPTQGGDAPRPPAAVQTEIQQVESELARHAAPLAYIGVRKQPGPTHLLIRGDILKPGERVLAGSLSGIRTPPSLQLSAEAPEAQRRLRFAAWVASPDNPLTARVMVNRIWHHHFGQGLVDTPSDFGWNGGKPTHPELLDWLAREFIRSGWSVKHMHRLIMNSALYRQSGPARSPRRLEAEIIRDAMLAVSGELNSHLGGPSFRPFTVTVRNHNFYHPLDSGEPEFNRRTVYRMNINTGKSPFLDALDCPAPSLTTPKRRTTVTALQALALMNDAFVQRQAAKFAERVKQAAGEDVNAQVALAYQVALTRAPSPAEHAATVQLVRAHGLPQACWTLLNTSEFLHVR
jgi:mono/diheme cytochrome c family protein